MRLYLIRHALTASTGPDAREWPLAPEGEGQAEKLAAAVFWRGVSALYSSPEAKALATVRPACERHGLEIREDDRLREAQRPAAWIDDYEAAVRRYLERREATPAGWENAAAVLSRVARCIAGITCRHPGEDVAVCSHGLALSLYLGDALRTSAFDPWRSMGFARVALVKNGHAAPFGAPAEVRW